jgi:hypothetical protein
MQLICEGLCNPNAASCDEAVERYRHENKNVGGGPIQPLMDERVIASLRQLTHTEHEPMQAGHFYRCVRCGAIRRCGGNQTLAEKNRSAA